MLKRFFKNTTRSNLTTSKLIFFGLLSLTLTACSKEDVKVKPPAPAVSVYSIKSQSIGGYREFVARTEASKEADLRARVEGELLERRFREGSFVEKGQVLLRIDPAAYQAALSSAKADLSSKESGEENAKRNLKRANDLINDGYISQSDFDRLTTEESQAKSAVKSAQAALEQAELDLSYTTITAPFSGLIGKVNFNVGNIVSPTSNALATLIISDPIFVSFQVEESTYVSYQQEHQGSKTKEGGEFDISLRLPNNSEYPESGKLDFADTKISEGMGTVELRTVFPNPHNIIIPGLFVTLILESQKKEEMALIPQAAVQEGQQGKFVLIVDENNKVKQRHVVLGRRINAMWVAEKGVAIGEKVIIEGLQKVRSGVEVRGVEKHVDPLVGTISDLDDKSVDSSKVNEPTINPSATTGK
ncbi:efflux RND transporter periplasmic adaptor subunit [Colwellia demingiae]|uniref:Efflux RND transporter periplasmic adaptor subunit n=1 Tax=Colwellia demingiae TaxID=89401 RepID=A0A5C6QLV3_9GAMM|nr:efflux RND transporter periplasmic adaptor subunit [Colwellia demingiae]TWX69502.1 efflux RND transporter periplasmic adaptor subunit [Colwellia demingiae]